MNKYIKMTFVISSKYEHYLLAQSKSSAKFAEELSKWMKILRVAYIFWL